MGRPKWDEKGPGRLTAAITVRRLGFTLRVALEAAPGERIGLIGPNGSGKSTLLGALAGHLRLAVGTITLDGRRLDGPGRRDWAPPHRRGVVTLGQEPHVFPHLSVRANIEYGPKAQGRPAREAARRAGELIEGLGLAGLAAARGSQLSGGQKARVALARALAADPALLLLDEPFASLDLRAAAELRAGLAAELERRSTTCLIATHALLDLTALADKVIVLEAGAVADAGEAERVLGRPRAGFAADLAGVGRVPGTVADGLVETVFGRWPLAGAARARGAATVYLPQEAVAVDPAAGPGEGAFRLTGVTTVASGLLLGFEAAPNLILPPGAARHAWLQPGKWVLLRFDLEKLDFETTDQGILG